MKFVKAHCGANDFIILDSRRDKMPENFKGFVQRVTERRTGVGADGVIVIENSGGVDFRLRYFNPDGSEYDVCGNGVLCALLYEGKKGVTFSTGLGSIKGFLTNDMARVKLVGPREAKLSLRLKVGAEAPTYPDEGLKVGAEAPTHPDSDKMVELSFVDIGVPHAIIFVDDVESIDMDRLARPIRFHRYFGKGGTNVNFMQVIDKNRIATRTYERGVEGETFSCGSGSCACAIVGWLKGVLLSPIEVKTKGGEFWIYINGLDEIWLEGKPEVVYEGEIQIPKSPKYLNT